MANQTVDMLTRIALEGSGAQHWLACGDGTVLSVVAGPTEHCLPERAPGPYTHVEVGYPTVRPPEWKEEYEDLPGLYRRVPVEVVRGYIETHGGQVGAYETETDALRAGSPRR